MIWPVITIVLAVAAGWWIQRLRRQVEEARASSDRFETKLAALEQKHKAAFHELDARQEALFNSMVEGLLLVDQDGKIKAFNRTLGQLLAVSRDIRGQTILEAFRLHALDEMAREVAANGRVQGFELEPPGMDYRCLQVSGASINNSSGHSTGMIFVFHDLTRLKQLENNRKDFVANVSHELRTPLTLIKGFVETLLDGAMDDPSVSTRFLETISKHADRLTFLIEDLLVISRLESGQVNLASECLDLFPLAQRVVDDLAAKATDRRVTLINQIPPETMAYGDRDRLLQVFTNLIDNAIKYGRNGGQVRITCQLEKVEKGGFWRCGISDDGPGIPYEARERVFERFYRVDKGRAREQGGTGLGLSIVKHIVQVHGGRVWVESELEKGSTFYFTVPVAPLEDIEA